MEGGGLRRPHHDPAHAESLTRRSERNAPRGAGPSSVYTVEPRLEALGLSRSSGDHFHAHVIFRFWERDSPRPTQGFLFLGTRTAAKGSSAPPEPNSRRRTRLPICFRASMCASKLSLLGLLLQGRFRYASLGERDRSTTVEGDSGGRRISGTL